MGQQTYNALRKLFLPEIDQASGDCSREAGAKAVRLEFLKAAARIERKATRVSAHLAQTFRFKEVLLRLATGEEKTLA